MTFEGGNQHTTVNKILVIGACALDRLLHVPSYPKEDGKILCKATFEYGGGNAANTASALGRISTSNFVKERTKVRIAGRDGGDMAAEDASIKIQLLTKVARDNIMSRLCKELRDYSVDLSSELFMYGDEGSTSPIATVVVSSTEHSRTCFFDKGTCGVLDSSDVENAQLDEILKGATLVHSDTRHTDAAVALAQEATKRGIQLSIDVERDRPSEAFDQLIGLATTIFTNENQMKQILDRWKLLNDGKVYFSSTDIQLQDESLHPDLEFYVDTICTFYGLHNSNAAELIVTRGCRGALQCRIKNYHCAKNSILIQKESSQTENKAEITYNESHSIIDINQSIKSIMHEESGVYMKHEKIEYEIHVVGPPKVPHIIDTTGAGDAFIAGYLLAKVALAEYCCEQLSFDYITFQLRMGSWVAGKKLGGPGARASLPSSDEVDQELGMDIHSMNESLTTKVESGCLSDSPGH